jgi:EAL domain-containing protein (putative c-di-GMP-specific phosphodiesterase class I)
MHRRVCQIIRKWLDAGVKPVPVSVNVSRVYLDDPNLANELKEVVEEYDIPLELFQVEITETYENKEADSTIKRLKKAGFTLLMDDFGSGYSSLNTLKNTPFDVIKLDREFFGHSMLTDRGQKILTHTIAMTNDIGMEIVAEGVETKEQAAFLDANGCKFAQGYLYYRPEPLDVFEENAFGHSVPE